MVSRRTSVDTCQPERIRRTRLLTAGGAFAVVVLLLGSTFALAQRDDQGPPLAGPTPSTSLSGTTEVTATTSPSPAPAIAGRRPLATSSLVRAGKDAQLLAAVKAEALAEVTPYGLVGAGSYGGRDRFGVVAGEAMASTASGAARAEGPHATTAPSSEGAPVPDAPAAQGSAGTGAAEFSGTNNQEKGVDEADQVKNDGRTLFVSRAGKVTVLDVSRGDPRVIATVDVPNEQVSGLLLAGPRLLVFSAANPPPYAGPAPAESGRPFFDAPQQVGTTKVRTVDVGDPSKPKVVATSELEGSFVDARLVAGVARLVLTSGPKLELVYPQQGTIDGEKAALAENKRRIADSTLSSWLPAGSSTGRTYRTQKASGLDVTSVRSIDPATAVVGPAVSVVTSAQVVYASLTSLYLATTEIDQIRPMQKTTTNPAPETTPIRTSIHKLDISDSKEATYVGSGDVMGTVLNQYSLSEQGDALRIATTTQPSFFGGPQPLSPEGTRETSQSSVTVFRPSAGALVEVGQVSGLGKGERIYGVRFVGDRGYVVTFRQVDPLYVLDLGDPTRPKVAGELKITGYSAYLHPVGPNRILGVGAAASEQGRREGFQISLFDVSDPANPQKLAGASIPGGSSQVEFDPHAFLWWEPAGLALVPVTTYDPSGPSFAGVVGYGVGTRTIAERGRISHPNQDKASGSDASSRYPYRPQIERSVIVGSRIFTISQAGVMASDVGTLGAGAFAPFG